MHIIIVSCGDETNDIISNLFVKQPKPAKMLVLSALKIFNLVYWFLRRECEKREMATSLELTDQERFL